MSDILAVARAMHQEGVPIDQVVAVCSRLYIADTGGANLGTVQQRIRSILEEEET